mmetsp:Transcript_17398/g.37425  ORF Transcript_17398/g.37425 Transcript_17398/m.37425 type:complete len:242 (+) Transcript_17398:482-1207(+)
MRPGPEGNDGVKIAKTSAGRSIPIKITCTAQPQDTSASAKRPRRNTTLTPKAAAAAAAAAEEAAEEDDEEASAPAFAAVAAPAKPLIVCLPSSGQALLTKEERALKDMYAELRAQREAEASARAAVASDSSAHARTMAAAAAASGGGGGGGTGRRGGGRGCGGDVDGCVDRCERWSGGSASIHAHPVAVQEHALANAQGPNPLEAAETACDEGGEPWPAHEQGAEAGVVAHVRGQGGGSED